LCPEIIFFTLAFLFISIDKNFCISQSKKKEKAIQKIISNSLKTGNFKKKEFSEKYSCETENIRVKFTM